MMNTQDSRVKLTALETRLNKYVIGVVIVVTILCISVSVMTTSWNLNGALMV